MSEKNEKTVVGNYKIDWLVTIIPFAIVVLVGIMIAFNPDAALVGLSALRNFFVNDLGFTYMIFGVFMIAAALWLAFSKYGNIKLGDLEKPRYSTFSWGGMIFTATMAADVLYWSIIEWAYYYTADPLGYGATRTIAQGQDVASAYPLFHWGPIPWTFYILPATAYAYFMFVKKAKRETMSEACRPIFGKHVDGFLGRIIDIICIAGLLAGCATIFSIATPLITASFSGLTGIPDSKWITILALVATAVIFTAAVVIGMSGIRWVSDRCIYLYVLLMAVFFFCGPMRYVIETGLTSIGFMTQHFITMSTWMDPLRISGEGGFGFPQDWTVFFYANWIAWSVATPFFIGKISEGRTIRNTILGAFIAGMSATFLSFIIFGNYGLNLEVTGKLDISGMINEGISLAAVILEIFRTLPISKIVMLVTIVVMMGLYATTFDATSLVLSYFSQKNLPDGVEPSKSIKIYWSIVLILLPISMVFAESILTTMQTVSIIAAFPIMVTELIIVIGFFKEMRKIGTLSPVPYLGPKPMSLYDYPKQPTLQKDSEGS